MDVLYNGPWKFTVNLNDGAGASRTVKLSDTISIKDRAFVFTEAAVSPFAITLNFHCDEVDESNSSTVAGMLPSDITVTLSDGKALIPNEITTSSDGETKAGTVRDFSVFVGGGVPYAESTTWYGTYVIMFNVPVKADDIKAVTIGDNTFDLSSSK